LHEDNDEKVWFPEPEKWDDTYGRRGESTPSFLARSTLPRARNARAFLNRNLAVLPKECQEGIYRHLSVGDKYESAFFELVVARMLQELGASIIYEPENEVDETKIDFLAEFPDYPVAVEAICPVFNKDTAETARNRNRLTDFVERSQPEGWRVAIAGLPNIGPAGSIRQFKAAVKQMLDVPPPARGEEKRELSCKIPEGEIRLNLRAETTVSRKKGTKNVGHEAPLSLVNEAEGVIRNKVKDKYRQAKNVEVPVLVAVQADKFFERLQDFDMALFGHYHLRLDESMSFKANGLFSCAKEGEPTIAGVLAFTQVGMLRCSEPIIYVHPRFSGNLPDALCQLEQRKLTSCRSGIQSLEARKRGFLEALRVYWFRRLITICFTCTQTLKPEGLQPDLPDDARLSQPPLVGVLPGEGELPVREAVEVVFGIVDELLPRASLPP
jgi:hypothetical protein